LEASFQDGIVEFNQDSIPNMFGRYEIGNVISVV
jgi:hypothetical protein